MKLPKLLHTTMLALLAVLLFTSCEENIDTIKDYDKDKLSITTYADDTEVKGGFSFTATEAWTTAIDYGESVRSGSNDWVTLDPASGNAGEVTITITLDENLTGEDRNATIRIICGETTLTITIEQRSNENPNGDNNGTQENDSTSTGDDPIQNEKIYAINKISIDINESESENITYYFYHKNNDPRSSINRVVVEGSIESGKNIEHILNYESDKLNIKTYHDGILYETIEANINNLYIDNYTYIETLEEMDASEGTTYEGISKETYNFYREGGKLYKTSRRKEIIFEGKPSWNLESEETYNLTWEHSNMSDIANDIFNNPFNLTEISWSEENGDTYDYFTYNHNITLANVVKGPIRPITEPGSFIDLNYIIANLWVSGIYYAYGSYSHGIIGLLGLTTAPNYNFVNFVTYRQVDGDYVNESNGCHIDYELNENDLISKVLVDGEIELHIGYREY